MEFQPVQASILSSFEPLSAAFLSVLWLRVPFDILQLLGTLCIINTVVVLYFLKHKKI